MDGARVLMPRPAGYDPATETPMMQTGADAPLRGAGTPEKPFGFWDATIDGGWQVPGEPYTSASEEPERQFQWWRARMLGGRTNHWGRISLRNGPYDFKPHSRDGLGFDWPMNYEDLAPYYDKVEMLIGVYGENDGMENTPNSPAGVLLPAPRPLVSDLLFRKHAVKVGVPAIAGIARCSPRLDHTRLPNSCTPAMLKAQAILAADMQKRSAVLFRHACGRGRSIRASTYQSTTAHRRRRSTRQPRHRHRRHGAHGHKRADGKAEGVVFIDRKTGAEHRIKARIVVLAASALESVRILLNSGVANSSGKVGKYIMDTVGARVRWPGPGAREPAAAQRGRRRWHDAVRPGGCTRSSSRASSVRARLPHRVRRWARHARHGHRGRPRNGPTAATTARSSRKTRAAYGSFMWFRAAAR
jgi:choline dehydrogenase-like flavoprotein